MTQFSGKFKFLTMLAVSAVFLYGRATAQESWYVNPGAKFGYAFGDNGGFIAGLEVSLVRLPESNGVLTGLFLSLEGYNSIRVIHFGIEAARIVGVSVGPSWVISRESTTMGVAGTIFGGLLILPYYRCTFLTDQSNIHEVGSFLKFAVKLSGPDIRFN